MYITEAFSGYSPSYTLCSDNLRLYVSIIEKKMCQWVTVLEFFPHFSLQCHFCKVRVLPLLFTLTACSLISGDQEGFDQILSLFLIWQPWLAKSQQLSNVSKLMFKIQSLNVHLKLVGILIFFLVLITAEVISD